MLGKYIKNEFKDTSKIMLILSAIIIGLTLIGRIAMTEVVSSFGSSNILLSIFNSIYVLGIISCSILSFIYMADYFYKTMFGDTGYLTHTLPLKKHTIINVKLLVWFVWNLIIGILVFESVLLLGGAEQGIVDINVELGNILKEYASIHMIFIVLLGFVSQILEFMFCFSIGQLSNEHKVGFAIVAYIVVRIIGQIVIFSVLFASKTIITEAMQFEQMISSISAYAYIVLGISIAIFYFGTLYLSKNKLNLK